MLCSHRACVLTVKWKRRSEAEPGMSEDHTESESVQVFRVHVLSSCCHVWVLLALRCHFPPSMSQNYPQFHLIVPVAFYQVCSVMVVRRETSIWREATALENYSDNNRSQYRVDVCLQNASYQPLGVTAQQSFIPLQESESRIPFLSQSNFSVLFFSGFFSCPHHFSVCFTLYSVSGLLHKHQILSFSFSQQPYEMPWVCAEAPPVC